MSEPATEMFETVSVKKETKVKPAREMSQAAITSFFYGTLQLLFTSISSALVLVLMYGIKVATAASASPTGASGGTDTANLAEIQKMIGGTVPSAAAPPEPSAIPGMPNLSGLTAPSTPHQIVPLEVLVILLTNGFGILSLITAVVAFRATSKGKSGRGLAVTGFISSFISFVIAFGVAWII